MKAYLAMVFIGKQNTRTTLSNNIYIFFFFGFEQPSKIFSTEILAELFLQHLAEGLECFKHLK